MFEQTLKHLKRFLLGSLGSRCSSSWADGPSRGAFFCFSDIVLWQKNRRQDHIICSQMFCSFLVRDCREWRGGRLTLKGCVLKWSELLSPKALLTDGRGFLMVLLPFYELFLLLQGLWYLSRTNSMTLGGWTDPPGTWTCSGAQKDSCWL